MQSVLIIGAGVAGLAAAYRLAEAGIIQITILEARNRIGGRIDTRRASGWPTPVELGAEFIHGKPPEILEIARGLKLPVGPLEGDNWRRTNGSLNKCNDFWTRWERVAKAIRRTSGEDQSFSQFIKEFPADPETKESATEFVQGFNAARANRIGITYLRTAQIASDRISGDMPSRILAGYDSVARWLAAPNRTAIRLNTPVHEIEWKPGRVRVNGFEASHAVITLPLGVLQSNKVRFQPEIKTKTNALESLAMGSVVKVILHFDTRFWEDLGLTNLAFLHARSEPIPTWWTTRPVVAPILTGWAGGPSGEALAFKKESEVLKIALDSLARTLNMRRNILQRRLRASFVADWQTDPFSLGAYSYIPVGGLPATWKLAEPIQETLFFAGEAANTEGHSGTVHGAIATGYRAAAEILAVVKRRAA